MVAWWPLDENEGDISAEVVWGNNGGWNGEPTPVAGKVDGALDFNGVTDYVQVPNHASLNFGTGNFSIDAWVKTSAASGIKCILDKRSGAESTPTGYAFSVLGGNLVLQMADGTWTNYQSTLLVADGNWHHVAATVDRDVNNGLKLYVNGVSQTFNPMAHQGSMTNDANLLIGASCYSTGNRFNGNIDEVELFNRALTGDEVKAIYQAGSDGKCKCEKGPTAFTDDIKWSQPPVENGTGCIIGWDDVSNYYAQPIIADDWICKDNRPITDIHWWGSFKGWTEDVLPADKPNAFHIGIWTDVYKSSTNTFSHPGRLIWENICDCSVWSYAGCDIDPRGIDQNESCFRFDQLLSQDQWFYQDTNEPRGTVYWLSIAAIYDGTTPVHPWGWKTRSHFYHDDAVRIRLPVSKCPNSCPEQDYSEFPAGINDNFTLPTEPAVPLGSFGVYVNNWQNAPRQFDTNGCDMAFGHTFTGLPECIKSATLEICLRANCSLANNDTLHLEYLGGSAFAWHIGIKNLPGFGQWNKNDQNCITLDLNNLPPSGTSGTSVLGSMELSGKLDVFVQDDTAVDYMILRVWSCPLVTGQWPPTLGSLWEYGEPIEYPEGTSWDTAFVLTTNRKFSLRRGYYPTAISDASVIDTPPSQLDFDGDLVVNFKDFAVFAGQWLTEGEVWPEWDLP
jgi:hypothetical protein